MKSIFNGIEFKEGSINIAFANPNSCKTTYLINEGINLAKQGYDVTYLSTEDNLVDLAIKAFKCNNNSFDLEKGNLYFNKRIDCTNFDTSDSKNRILLVDYRFEFEVLDFTRSYNLVLSNNLENYKKYGTVIFTSIPPIQYWSNLDNFKIDSSCVDSISKFIIDTKDESGFIDTGFVAFTKLNGKEVDKKLRFTINHNNYKIIQENS